MLLLQVKCGIAYHLMDLHNVETYLCPTDYAYRTSNALERVQELSRPFALQHAVFSWHVRFSSVAPTSDGAAVEFSSLRQQNQIQPSQSLFSLSGPQRISISRQLVA